MRNTTKVWAVIVAVMLLSAEATAMEPEEMSCGNKFDTVEKVNQCLNEALTHAEIDIQAMQQALLTALEFARGQLQTTLSITVMQADEVFTKAQQAWLAYRDVNCKYFDQVYAPVSPPGIERVVCMLRMTRQRLRELNDERQFWVYKFRVPDLPPVEEAK